MKWQTSQPPQTGEHFLAEIKVFGYDFAKNDVSWTQTGTKIVHAWFVDGSYEEWCGNEHSRSSCKSVSIETIIRWSPI